MKCKICGKVEGFDGSFFTLYCSSCLNKLLKKEPPSLTYEILGEIITPPPSPPK